MNPRILVLAVGVAIGYVLGARDGRPRYDAIKARLSRLWEDPRVAKARNDVQSYAREQAPIIRDRAEAAAKDVAAKTAATAKDVAAATAATAKDVAAKVTDVTADAREQAGKIVDDVREHASKIVGDSRVQATRIVGDLRASGESAVDTAVSAVGAVRDNAMDVSDDDDKPAAT